MKQMTCSIGIKTQIHEDELLIDRRKNSPKKLPLETFINSDM